MLTSLRSGCRGGSATGTPAGVPVRRVSSWVSELPLFIQRRRFQVIQRGHDRLQESLFDKLGFAKDTEARRVRRSTTELQQGLLRRVEELKDPVNDPADRKRLEELKEAYTLLHNTNFRANYSSHPYSSNDAQLHVLCSGGQVAANFNPEHQQFTYVDHAIDRESTRSRVGTPFSGGQPCGPDYKECSPASRELPTAEALRNAFRDATGVGNTSSFTTSSSATAYNAVDAAGPDNGNDITHLLRITLEQSLIGCEVEVELHKNVRCTTCRGSGRQQLRSPRRCPQCLGRGYANMPSATYHIERRCLYCGGEGTVPAPPCGACKGRGVKLNQVVRVPVKVPTGTPTNSFFRLHRHGHDGVRGGHAGDLLITVLVSEHHYFYRSVERPHELHAMLPLPLSVALLGGRVRAPTLSGFGTVHVPPCVRNGEVLPLDVYGAVGDANRAAAASTSPHSIFYHVLVIFPRGETLSGRQKAALQVFEAHHVHPVKRVDAEVVPRSSAHDGEGPRQREPDTSKGRDSSADLMKSCSELKSLYRHWFHAD